MMLIAAFKLSANAMQQMLLVADSTQHHQQVNAAILKIIECLAVLGFGCLKGN